MTTPRILSLAVTGALVLLASCGGHDGVELGPFAALTATEGDAPITLTAPTSKSPAPFFYTSSDSRVATVQGDKLIIGEVGTSTITAQQGREGSYYPTSTSTTLTVAKRVCEPPAVLESGACVTPPATASYVTTGALSWMPTWFTRTWAQADAYCKGEKINGSNGWRLPNQFELTALVASGELAEKKWVMQDTWTSSAGAAEKQHVAVNLATNATTSVADANKAFVTCVR
ncbi:DUF1566 domain-containing protein [Massilia niabensis]|uniref:DUF1566 domain-containing protein n=1 Tax=Massilia niabensis TaxID=544910 RepID=A0ABW0LBT1_9BURK